MSHPGLLPVQPHLHALSDVATIEFVHVHVSELDPRVLLVAYDADLRATERGGLCFEWMITENLKITGSVSR